MDHLIEDIHECDHVVQFYEDDHFLIDKVAAFIEDPGAPHHASIVIATASHHAAIQRRLSAKGRVMALDADVTLDEFMVHGRTDAGRFFAFMGNILAPITDEGRKPVRIFGEMVAQLWARGQYEAALELEELWNQLAGQFPFLLLCAYPIRGFSAPEHLSRFNSICASHSVVCPTESYVLSRSPERGRRMVAQLQQKAQALEAEIARREEAERRLQERERELADFIENAVEGLHQVGPDGRILWANQAELDLLGYRTEEYVGHHIAEFHVDQETIADLLDRLLRGETVYDYPARLRCKDGSIKDVLIHSNALWRDGQFIRTRCFTRDITERKRAEERLDQRVAERTRELAHSQQRLRALASQLSLAEQRVRKEVATELHDYLAQLLIVLRMKLFQAGQRATDPTVAGLLIEADRVLDESIMYTRSLMADLTPPVLQFGLVISLRWLADKFRRHNLTVGVKADAVDVELTDDQIGLLFQSVRELLMNVVKHGKTNRAQVSLSSHGDGLTIEVSDEGCGFDPIALAGGPQTFDAASQFGLFSIRERMEALGGRFDLQSSPGAGTRASLILPYGMKTAPPEATSDPAVSATSLPGAKPVGTIRVLLVDDHAMVRQGLRGILDSYRDLEVVGEAADGQEAIDLARVFSPDVVVMDVNLPKIDGVEATRQIKRQRPSTAVIGLSVHQASQIEHVLREAGASGYVTKDSAGDRLYEAIIYAVGQRDPIGREDRVPKGTSASVSPA